MGAVEIRALPLVASILLVLYSFLLTEKKKKKRYFGRRKDGAGCGEAKKERKGNLWLCCGWGSLLAVALKRQLLLGVAVGFTETPLLSTGSRCSRLFLQPQKPGSISRGLNRMRGPRGN